MPGLPNKTLGQAEDMMDTGLQKTAKGAFDAKAVDPKSASPLHNRGLTVGGKARTGGGGKVSPKVVAAIKLSQTEGPKAPHPAMQKKSSGAIGVKWG